MIEQLTFALIPAVRLRLPSGYEIAGVTVENDVSKLLIDVPDGAPSLAQCVGRNLEWKERVLRTFFEGEHYWSRNAEGELVKGDLVPIPEPSETLRKLGVIETIETPARWHIFEQTEPKPTTCRDLAKPN